MIQNVVFNLKGSHNMTKIQGHKGQRKPHAF